MGGPVVLDKSANSCEESGGKSSSKKKSKAKGHHDKKRFQLFDPSAKSDLLGLCEDGLVRLQLEEGESEDNGDADHSVSLDFDEGSSDEDDMVENLPLDDDDPVLTGSKGKRSGQEGQSAGLCCGTCNAKFADLSEQRIHYTLDWHRYNVKRKLQGQAFVTEAKFDEMIDDLSSIDGSDNEEEDTAFVGSQAVDRLLEKLNFFSPDSGLRPSQLEQARLSSSQKLEKSPKVFFKNKKGQIITCFKTILSRSMENQDGVNESSVLQFTDYIRKPLRISIIMASGGHFAAAVFEGNTCTLHKTFHSYTVRAKQGGTQGSHDAKSGTSNAKSAGASLRRYNQQSYTQHVQELLTSWKGSIAGSDLVFYKANSGNANVLFTGKNPPLTKESKNLKTIPFPTKRPTFSEVKRVHSLLTTVHLYASMESFLTAHSHLVKNEQNKEAGTPVKSKHKKKVYDRAKSRSPKRKDDLNLDCQSDGSVSGENTEAQQLTETDHLVDFSELKEYDDSLTPEQRREGRSKKKKSKKAAQTFQPEGILAELFDSLQLKDAQAFKMLLDKVKDTTQATEINGPVDIQASTLLHIASKNNHLDIVWSLLEAGCDPSIKDKSGKYPYNYADTRECRDVFRNFMKEYPQKYDYKKVQVPPPLSEEQEKERAEKKKLLNRLKKEKEKQKKSERKEKEKETEEQRRFLNLSDREKRALAAEQRILAQCKKNSEKAPVLVRCFECACDITGKVPFEYNQNVFCTTKCLAAHRKKFPCPLSV